ncbi:MAG: hypothetical protein U0821_11835 [Chloroflexota bacterium]
MRGKLAWGRAGALGIGISLLVTLVAGPRVMDAQEPPAPTRIPTVFGGSLLNRPLGTGQAERTGSTEAGLAQPPGQSEARAAEQTLEASAAAARANENCGPPSDSIPGPPPRLIQVGKAMSDTWLLCYIRQDFEGQDYQFRDWGEVRRTAFRGYPVECWNAESPAGATARTTDGLVAAVLGVNRDGTQSVRFSYRIQLDGDYINLCRTEIL